MKAARTVLCLLILVVAMTLPLASQAQAALSVSVAGKTIIGETTPESYIVVLDQGQAAAGYKVIEQAGGTIVRTNKLDIVTVTSANPAFEEAISQSSAVLGVARNAGFKQAPALKPAAAPPGTKTEAAEAAACAALYSVTVNIGPDPLAPCQWDMRAINATTGGSYPINQGQGVRVGDMDTGIDLNNSDIMPNVDVATSCVFLYATTPTSDPSEQVTRGDCSNKAALQDLAGHGTHTAGTIGAPINGTGISGVAPKATIVVLKSGTAEGYFFTESVVDGLMYAGDQKLDVVSMSFFADPWLFNCKNNKEQKAIVQAISRAAKYAQQNGVVLVAAAGNEGIDINHPVEDELSPDFPPGAAVTRPVNNSCVILPEELPGVVVVTATGAENLLAWYSSYGMETDVTAPGGSRFQTPSPDTSRGRVLSTYSSTASDLAAEAGLGRLVIDPLGNYYAWLNGTSMAAPHAAGVAALIRAAHPDMPQGAVAARLRSTATKLPCPTELDPGVEFFGAPVQECSGGPGKNNFYGAGLINALKAAQ